MQEGLSVTGLHGFFYGGREWGDFVRGLFTGGSEDGLECVLDGWWGRI